MNAFEELWGFESILNTLEIRLCVNITQYFAYNLNKLLVFLYANYTLNKLSIYLDNNQWIN